MVCVSKKSVKIPFDPVAVERPQSISFGSQRSLLSKKIVDGSFTTTLYASPKKFFVRIPTRDPLPSGNNTALKSAKVLVLNTTVVLLAQSSSVRSPSKRSPSSPANVNLLIPSTSFRLNCTSVKRTYKLVLVASNSEIARGRGVISATSFSRTI